MTIRKLKYCEEIIAGDGSRLRELFHPDREYTFTSRFSLAHATVPVGEKTLKHRLKSDEVYYILSGRGELHIDHEIIEVETGDAIDIPPGSTQWIRNTGGDDLVFLCVVDPAWQQEDEEVMG